jgi:hypothetical protein
MKQATFSRRRLLTLFGLPVVAGLAVVTSGLAGLEEAEAETAGMNRRENRRGNRHERRNERRAHY